MIWLCLSWAHNNKHSLHSKFVLFPVSRKNKAHTRRTSAFCHHQTEWHWNDWIYFGSTKKPLVAYICINKFTHYMYFTLWKNYIKCTPNSIVREKKILHLWCIKYMVSGKPFANETNTKGPKAQNILVYVTTFTLKSIGSVTTFIAYVFFPLAFDWKRFF